MSIKTLNFLTSLLLLISSSASFSSRVLETREEAPLTATKPQQPKITFKNFTFDPNTKQFAGDIFDEAQVVADELGAYYTGKYQAAQKQLALAREQLSALKQQFNLEKYETLRTLKREKGAEEFKQSDAYESYKQLKAQHGEILLYKARMSDLKSRFYRYDEHRETMSSIPQLLQHVFYITYLEPNAFYTSISTSYYSEKGTDIEISTIDFLNLSDNIRNLKAEQLECIDMELLQEDGPVVFEFLHGRARAFHERKIKKVMIAEQFFELEKSQEIRGFLSLLPATLPKEELYKTFIDNEKRVTIKELHAYEKKIKNEIAPLANFHNDTVDALETFRQEVKGTQAS